MKNFFLIFQRTKDLFRIKMFYSSDSFLKLLSLTFLYFLISTIKCSFKSQTNPMKLQNFEYSMKYILNSKYIYSVASIGLWWRESNSKRDTLYYGIRYGTKWALLCPVSTMGWNLVKSWIRLQQCSNFSRY